MENEIFLQRIIFREAEREKDLADSKDLVICPIKKKKKELKMS